MSSQVHDPSFTAFVKPLAHAIEVPPTLLPSQSLSELVSSTASVGTHFPGFIAAQYGGHSQVTTLPSSTHHSQIQPLRTRKRKASTMSATKWAPAENRIKELWIDEEKTLDELRDFVNSEFGFTANNRQYKSQIKRLKLEKNAKEEERRPIARHLKYRERQAKQTKYVRIRGHEIALAKRTRWVKELMSPSPLSSPSPLPSYISVLTGSPSGPPAMLPHTLSPNQQAKSRPFSPTEGFNGAIQRLFAYTDDESVKFQETRPILNALQLILGCKHQKPPRKYLEPRGASMKEYIRNHIEPWDAVTEEYITLFRNPQTNFARKIDIHREWNRTHGDGLELQDKWRGGPSRGCHRHAYWWTSYGMIQISFATTSNDSHHGSRYQENLSSLDEVLATRITFIPNRSPNFSYAAVFDFGSSHDPFARITYQAMIPNQSIIFRVVSAGDIDGLIKMLKEGSGRLTDRDEEGRSLLNYSLHNSRVDMTKFLLQKQQDPDASELDVNGFVGLLHGMPLRLDSDFSVEERNKHSECHRLMLESGADFSLPYNFDGTYWESGFKVAVESCSEAALKQILKLGGPFVNSNTEVIDRFGNAQSALSQVASYCGYFWGNTIHVVDKAIYLLKRKADISYRNSRGDTVLHALLSCPRAHENRAQVHRTNSVRFTHPFFLSLTEPRQLLKVLLSAGADVYAMNQKGETPSSVAKQYGREGEWIEALTACGYNHEEILAHSELGSFDHFEKRQPPQISFEDVCRQREEYLNFKKRFFEERCRICADLFDPSMISFNETCGQCGEKFRYKKESLDNQYQSLREQYLRDKDIWTQYYQRRRQILNDERVRFKKAYFEESCRNYGCQFQPEPVYSPEICLQCGARIRPRDGPMETHFEECMEEYFEDIYRYRLTHRQRNSNLDEDDAINESQDSHSDDDSDFSYDSDSSRDIASDEAEDIQINHSDFTTFNTDPNLVEGPRTEPNQTSFQAMDLDNVDVNTNLEERDNGWIPSLTEVSTDNHVVNAIVAEVAAEQLLPQTLYTSANDEALSFHSQVLADLNYSDDFFDQANDEALSFHSQVPADLNYSDDFFGLNWYLANARH